jgi:Zn-dependent protease
VFVETVGELAAAFTLFNLLPLSPLTGVHLSVAMVPGARDAFRRARPFLVVLLALLIVTGVVARLLAPAEAVVARVVLDE